MIIDYYLTYIVIIVDVLTAVKHFVGQLVAITRYETTRKSQLETKIYSKKAEKRQRAV